MELKYHKTTTKDKEELLKETVKAGTQSMQVYRLMQDGNKRTSLDVARALEMNLNSARRCLSDLKDKFGLLEKLEETKVEQYGKPNHYYIKQK